jgi:hypothetical protein
MMFALYDDRTGKKMEAIDFFKNQIHWITLREATILLRHLGNYHCDPVIIRHGGYYRMPAKEVWEIFSAIEYAINIRPIYFRGGPMQAKLFKGTYLTFLIDRCMLVSFEKGVEHVNRIISYAKRFAPLQFPTNNVHSI